MAKVTIYTYVCDNSEREAIDLVKSVSPMSPRNGQEAEKCMIEIMQKGSDSMKRQLLAGIVEIHPDFDLFMETQQILQENLVPAPGLGVTRPEEKYGCAGTCSCGGAKPMVQAPTLKATGDESNSNQNLALMTQVNAMQTETTTNKIISDKLFKIILAGVVLLIAYKMFVKSNA